MMKERKNYKETKENYRKNKMEDVESRDESRSLKTDLPPPMILGDYHIDVYLPR